MKIEKDNIIENNVVVSSMAEQLTPKKYAKEGLAEILKARTPDEEMYQTDLKGFISNQISLGMGEGEILDIMKECEVPEGEILTAYKGYKQDEEEAEALGLNLVSLDDIEETEVKWLFPNRIPKGEITILGGDGGTGKGGTVCNIIASVTTGNPSIFDEADGIPSQWTKRQAGTVLYFSSEDDFSKVVKPRLKPYNPDFKKIKTIQVSEDTRVAFNSKELATTIKHERPTLCIFDPLQSYIPDGTNLNARNEMRNCLNPLIQLGHKYGTTFIIVMHSNKRSVSGRNRLADSADMWDIARSVFLLGHADRQGGLYISHEKSNYGRQADTVLFKIADNGTVNFTATTDAKDYDFVTSQQAKISAPARDNTKEIILSQLEKAENYTMKVKELEAKLSAVGVSQHTARRAREEMKQEGIIKAYNTGYGSNKAFYISLIKKE